MTTTGKMGWMDYLGECRFGGVGVCGIGAAGAASSDLIRQIGQRQTSSKLLNLERCKQAQIHGCVVSAVHDDQTIFDSCCDR